MFVIGFIGSSTSCVGIFGITPLASLVPMLLILLFAGLLMARIIRQYSGFEQLVVVDLSAEAPHVQAITTAYGRVLAIPPEFCSRWSTPLRTDKVDWVDTLHLACPYCGATVNAGRREF
ncbi:MAG: hypothetical protein QXS20_05640 [Candidatus Thorarchaeota archaeon]